MDSPNQSLARRIAQLEMAHGDLQRSVNQVREALAEAGVRLTAPPLPVIADPVLPGPVPPRDFERMAERPVPATTLLTPAPLALSAPAPPTTPLPRPPHGP
ncbi:MAG TPA: hypothetical protein VM536_08115, partial [Chloroflexia bacterium]|nr:hypothetical protein [Chloroflexia bacterium]